MTVAEFKAHAGEATPPMLVTLGEIAVPATPVVGETAVIIGLGGITFSVNWYVLVPLLLVAVTEQL